MIVHQPGCAKVGRCQSPSPPLNRWREKPKARTPQGVRAFWRLGPVGSLVAVAGPAKKELRPAVDSILFQYTYRAVALPLTILPATVRSPAIPCTPSHDLF